MGAQGEPWDGPLTRGEEYHDGVSAGTCESTGVPLPSLRWGGGEEGISGRASWRRRWLNGALKGKDQGQVNRQ